MVEAKKQFCVQCGGQLDEYGRKLPVIQPDGFPVPSLAADNIVVRANKADPKLQEILLIKRGREGDYFKGKLAFPGGRVNYGEDPAVGCLRELEEECALKVKPGTKPKMLGVYGDPKRDPRGHIVSVVYIVQVDENAVPKAGDDAAEAHFMLLNDVLKTPEMFAFDHAKILQDYVAYCSKH